MAKLQQIKRTNSSVVNFVNIPLTIIEELDWKKGDILIVDKIDDKIEISKE